MENKSESLRERLLAQFEPDCEKLATYRKEIQAMLEKHEQTLRFQKRQADRMVIGAFFGLIGIGFVTLAGLLWGDPFGAWLGFVACFTVIGASVELVKYYIERSRVEVLKEVKGLELQLLEIKEQLQQHLA
jgi:hypothetical protein